MEDSEIVRRESEVVAVRGATVADYLAPLNFSDLPWFKRGDHALGGELADAPIGDGAGWVKNVDPGGFPAYRKEGLLLLGCAGHRLGERGFTVRLLRRG